MSDSNKNSTKRPIRRAVVISLLTLGLLFGFWMLVQPEVRRRQLRRACEDANRIVVDLNIFAISSRHPDGPVFPVFEVRGEEKVHALMDAIAMKSNWLPLQCRCSPDMVFRFYDGANHLASVGFCLGEFLRWRGLRWGEAWLTQESQTELLAWLKRNGCPGPDEARQQWIAIMDAWRAKRRLECETRAADSGPGRPRTREKRGGTQ